MSHWGSQPYKQKNSSFVSFYNLSNFSAWHKGGDLKKKIGKVGHRGEWSGVEWKVGGGKKCQYVSDMLTCFLNDPKENSWVSKCPMQFLTQVKHFSTKSKRFLKRFLHGNKVHRLATIWNSFADKERWMGVGRMSENIYFHHFRKKIWITMSSVTSNI